jgi:hypothetical protein
MQDWLVAEGWSDSKDADPLMEGNRHNAPIAVAVAVAVVANEDRTRGQHDKLRIFTSCSRNDQAFATALVTGLEIVFSRQSL